VTAAVFTAALWVQHAREAWPFAPASQTVAPLTTSEMPTAVGTAATHDRVPVDVNATTVQELGIRVEVVGREALTQEVRAVATVVPDESRISHVHTRVPGWVEQLDVNTTGEIVTAGQPLARIIVDACKEVGRPIFFSLLLITISFLPIFTLAGQAGRCSCRSPTRRRSRCSPPRCSRSRSHRR
jgi:hypothetical protein